MEGLPVQELYHQWFEKTRRAVREKPEKKPEEIKKTTDKIEAGFEKRFYEETRRWIEENVEKPRVLIPAVTIPVGELTLEVDENGDRRLYDERKRYRLDYALDEKGRVQLKSFTERGPSEPYVEEFRQEKPGLSYETFETLGKVFEKAQKESEPAEIYY